MEAGKRTINDIFNGSRVLEIPFFQRAYVWKQEQWERLLEDAETVSGDHRPYFLGAVILKQQQTSSTSEAGDIRIVIDGQQRLTTLSLLLKVLCLKTNQSGMFDKRFRLDDNTTVLKHNLNDIHAFNTIMDLKTLDDIKGTDNITSAYMFFKEKLDPEKVNFQAITNTILFVGIDLTLDEDEQQIFDTINSLGVTLTTAELLKNYFFNRNRQDLYNEYWKDVFERDNETKEYWDTEITTGRLKRTLIDLFFFSYLQIKIQESSFAVKAEDKNSFSKVETLFHSYKTFIKTYYNGDNSALLAEIRQYAQIFRQTFDPEIINDELPAEPGIERINAIIFALETTTLIPYVLYVEKNVTDQEVKKDLYGSIETYIMRRLITKETSKNYNQLFTDRLILNRVLSRQQFVDYVSNQEETVNHLPSDSQLQDAFTSFILTNKQSTGVLYMIESRIRDHRKHSTSLLGISKYSLEHLMPKKWRNFWPLPDKKEDEEKRNRKLLTLGNLAIITQALNTSIRDSAWETKKNGRQNKFGLKKYGEGIETLSPYLDLPDWDENTIDERAKDLYQNAREIWKV